MLEIAVPFWDSRRQLFPARFLISTHFHVINALDFAIRDSPISPPGTYQCHR
jgi:hypothetical protein